LVLPEFSVIFERGLFRYSNKEEDLKEEDLFDKKVRKE